MHDNSEALDDGFGIGIRTKGEVRRKVAILSKVWSVSMLVYIKLESMVKKEAQGGGGVVKR
jgi:hypothetical protein